MSPSSGTFPHCFSDSSRRHRFSPLVPPTHERQFRFLGASPSIQNTELIQVVDVRSSPLRGNGQLVVYGEGKKRGREICLLYFARIQWSLKGHPSGWK